MMTDLVFYLLAASALVSAVLTILQRNPVAAAMWLVSTMFALAAIYVLLSAPFIAAIQVLVYAGAVMVLFLFVIMLLNLGRDQGDFRTWPIWAIAGVLALALAVELVVLGRYTPDRLGVDVTSRPAAGGAHSVLAMGDSLRRVTESRGVVGVVAEPLFRSYLVPFEITSILLLTAAVGAVVLAKRKL